MIALFVRFLGLLQAAAFIIAIALTVLALPRMLDGVFGGEALLALIAWGLFLALLTQEEGAR